MFKQITCQLIIASALLVMAAGPGFAQSGNNADPVEVESVAGDTPMPKWMVEKAEEFRNSSKSVYNYLVQGRFSYRDMDGSILGIDGAIIRVEEVSHGFDLCMDASLGYMVSDPDGWFSIEAVRDEGGFCGSDTPDLQIKIDMGSGRVAANSFRYPFQYQGPDLQTRVYPDYTDPVLDVGTLLVPSGYWNDRAHILTNTQRALRWLVETGFDFHWQDNAANLAPAEILYDNPAGLPSHWASYGPEDWDRYRYFINEGNRWNDVVLTRHVCEQWVRSALDFSVESDLCNGSCDPPSGTICSYCVWSEESGAVALHRGLSEWMTSEILREFPDRYGVEPRGLHDFENLDLSGGSTDPSLTPGYFAAFLHDMVDATNDDHSTFPGVRDLESQHPGINLVVAEVDQPTTPLEFIQAMIDRWPDNCDSIWATAANSGFVLDLPPPGPLGPLSSATHAIGVESPNDRVTVDWTPPTGGCGNGQYYGVSVTPGAASLPPAIVNHTGSSSYITASLQPGTYFINVRVTDAAGSWRNDYQSYGPVIIRNPLPTNLVTEPRTGWTRQVVPRTTADSTPSSAPVATNLFGNTTSTYWNAAIVNTGDDTTEDTFDTWVSVDGFINFKTPNPVPYSDDGPPFGLGGMQTYSAMNNGPINVRGGRHTFGAYVDFSGTVGEVDEEDNPWGRQWIWDPLIIPENGNPIRSAPPARIGGWDSAPSANFYNCDGLRFSSSGWWTAMTLVSTEDWEPGGTSSNSPADYDMRLHTASPNSNAGFGTNVGSATRPAGCLDAVFVNRNVTGAVEDWDAGVVQSSDENSNADYQVHHVVSVEHAFGDSLQVTVPAGSFLEMREVYIESPQWVSVVAQGQESNFKFHLMWLSEDFETGDMDDNSWDVPCDDYGVARMDNYIPIAGYHCFVIYRDPKDGNFNSDLIVDFEAGPILPQLQTYQPAGWAGPIVPRPVADGTQSTVAMPTSLKGWAAETFVNASTRNESPAVVVGAVANEIFLDGLPLLSIPMAGYAASEQQFVNDDTARYVRGGRHTLGLRVDAPNDYEEISETDNMRAVQYGWSGLAITMGPTLGRPHPSDPSGGWEDLVLGGPLLNSDGYRTPAFTPGTGGQGTWGAVAAVSGDVSNVNLLLHPALDDPVLAFAATHAFSSAGGDETDFVLVDLNGTAETQFDVGVTHQEGAQDFQLEVLTSSYLANNPTGTHGPFSLAGDELLNLHEVDLSMDFLRVHLINNSANVDLGLSVHSADETFQGRADQIVPGTVVSGGPGMDDRLVVPIDTPGRYVIAVWKKGSADAALSLDYELDFLTVTDVAETPLPLRSGIVNIHPNPFNPMTTISFELQKQGSVSLVIYNARGNQVRRLVSENRASGRHEMIWNGQDDGGRSLPSGVYYVRVTGEGIDDRRKMTLLK